MSAVDELLKNLMQRAGIQKSRKRVRDKVYEEDKSYLPCRNTKTRQELSNTGSHTLEAKSARPEENNC